MPYGETWINEVSNKNIIDYKFTGKEYDPRTGLYYFGARYLDPQLSRWISTDPAIQDYIPERPVNKKAKKRNNKLPGQGGIFNPINLATYHYSGNNPLKYKDPDGKSTEALTLTTSAFATDLATPEPTDLAIPKWVGWEVTFLGIGTYTWTKSKDNNETETAQNESDNTVEDNIDDILEDAEPGEKTKGKSEQWEKEGGFEQAQEDFDHLNPDNVKDRSADGKQVKTGELEGDIDVNVRDVSSSGEPTLEVQYPNGKRLKIRYLE